MTSILGRGREVDRLEQFLSSIADHGQVLSLIGDPGIGKSALLQETGTRAAARGLTVLRTSGIEFESGMPFAGLHQLLRPWLGIADALPHGQRDALRRALGAAEGPVPTTFLVALAVLNLLAELAVERPVVVMADDVQWLDLGTEEVLAFVGRRIEHDPIGIVASTRPGHDGPFDQAGFRQIQLGPLPDDSARQLLRSLPGPERQQEEVLELAQGNPLALVELPRSAIGRLTVDPELQAAEPVHLTTRLNRAFSTRIAELSATGRDLVLVAAIDPSTDVTLLLAATGILSGTPVGVDTIEDVVSSGILRRDADRVRFSHPLMAVAARQREPASRRQAVHAVWSQVLDSDPYRRAWHRAGSVVGYDDVVAVELENLHATPSLRGSQAAVSLLERSAQLSTNPDDRTRRLLLAAEQAFNLGQVDHASRLLDAAGPDVGDELAAARRSWLRELQETGSPADAFRIPELSQRAQQALAGGDAMLGLNLVLTAAIRCWFDDPGAPTRASVVAQAQEMRRLTPGLGQHPVFVASLAFADPLGHGLEAGDLIRDLSGQYAADAQAMRVLGYAGIALMDLELGRRLLTQSTALLREEGRLGLLMQTLVGQIPSLAEMGDWDLADQHAAEASRLARDTGQTHWDSATRIERALIGALRGDNEEAQQLARWAPGAMQRNRKVRSLSQLVSGIGWLATGHYQEAYDALARMFDRADPTCHLTDRFKAVAYLAEAAVHCDHRAEATVLLAELDEEVGPTASAVLAGQRLYARAVLAPPGEEENRYHEALAADLTSWPWYRARTELAFGQWLRRSRRVAESRSLLRAAYATLTAMGASGWAAQAGIELRAAGDRSASPQPRVEIELSPQEMQIARLAADGLSNREIAAQLFLSHRTVGSHLYRIFPKVGVTSRAQLAARIQQLPDQAVV